VRVPSPASLAPSAALPGAPAPAPADPLGALLGAVPGLAAATDLPRLRDEWDR
jgi:hypothetical protein